MKFYSGNPPTRTSDSKSYLAYIPHGINPTKFYKVDEDEIMVLKHKIFGGNEYDFILYYNSRNIRRKQTSDIILAFDHFVSGLPEDKKKKVALLMHTQVIEDAGTNLIVVVRDVTPDIADQVFFYPDITEQTDINLLYNIADVTINISSNEGFGLSIAESLMTETPVIVNVTGGLQDQCGFVDETGELLDPEIHFTKDWGSNHDGKYQKHGDWVIPIFPSNKSIQGSPPTPYISDDRCRWEDVSNAIRSYYDMPKEERERRGKLGREFCLGPAGLNSDNMCNLFIKHMDIALENFVPRKAFIVEKI